MKTYSGQISTNGLWIRNCRQKRSPYKVHMQQRAAGGRCSIARHGCHLDSTTSVRHDVISEIRFRQCMPIYLREQSGQISSRSYLKNGALGFFEERRPNN